MLLMTKNGALASRVLRSCVVCKDCLFVLDGAHAACADDE
jgi:hypothetical protein